MTLFNQSGAGMTADYEQLRDDESESAQAHRTLLDEQWQAALPYLDDNFRSAFPYETAQRFWELRLISFLLTQGFELEPAQKYRPDIATRLPDGRRLWIEETAPTLGALGNPDRPRDLRPGMQPFPVEQVLLRLSQGVHDKTMKLREYRENGVIGRDDATVIGLSSGAHWPFIESSEHPRIMSVLFPFGDERVVIDTATGKALRVEHEYRGEVAKANGRAIPMLTFDAPAHADISGLIYDFARPKGIGQQDLGRFFTFENPHAQVRLPRHYLPLGRSYWVDSNSEGPHLAWLDHPRPA